MTDQCNNSRPAARYNVPKGIGMPAEGRAFSAVVEELLAEILPYRVRMNYPRSFGFIPSPLSPISWIGELITAAHNPHAGSWTQSAGPTVIECELLRWMADLLGLPASAGGVFVSGGSMANLSALVVARDQLLAESNRHQAVAYVSAQTHSSIVKGLNIIGFHPHQIRADGVGGDFRMNISELRAAVAEDLRPADTVRGHR